MRFIDNFDQVWTVVKWDSEGVPFLVWNEESGIGFWDKGRGLSLYK